jgi:hypothetical protein
MMTTTMTMMMMMMPRKADAIEVLLATIPNSTTKTTTTTTTMTMKMIRLCQTLYAMLPQPNRFLPPSHQLCHATRCHPPQFERRSLEDLLPMY